MWNSIVTTAASAVLASAAMAQAPCDADLDADGMVDGFDLAVLLAAWGPYAPCPPQIPADFDGSCVVNGIDLATLLASWGASCDLTTTQLAGNPLAQYPFFEYVRAFNQDAGFHVALDPTRFPDLVGKSCDLYIVAHRTPEQWASDPSLVDLTGGAQTVTVSGSTIQANTFAVSGSAALNGTQGTSIGVGYDAVLDCNRNGLLDAADLIDGLQPNDEAGLYVVRDTAAPGPYAVTELTYAVMPWTGTAGFESENTFFPTNIAELGPRPVVIIAHGNGHNYQWFDHIGMHLASYGFVVMSHENNDAPGVFAASTTTLQHTDAFIGQLTSDGPPLTPALAPLDGLLDTSRIVWLGHSRGGEGIVLAYDRVFDGAYSPSGWSLEGVHLVSSMVPTDFMGGGSNPGTVHEANYHVWYGASDSDVTGCAGCNLCQPYHFHDRAEQYRQATSMYGVGHADFHNGPGGSVATGVCLIGKVKTHAILKGYLLPLVRHFIEGDVAAKDFLTRQWESFKPIGAPLESPCLPPSGTGVDVVVNLLYRDGSDAGGFMIDDFQSNSSLAISSSGGAVAFDMTNLVEDRADDNNSDFTWVTSDPMNGTTIGGTGDATRIAVFDWSAPAFIEFEVIESQRDLSDGAYLSFRAAQGTRHPHTIAALEDLTFDVVLRDAAGEISRINVGAYGGGLEEPYQRTGCGIGTGWANEFETIRIRLTDFLTNGSGLDLSSIVAVRFEFAAPGSDASAVGRIGLDEIEITPD